MLYFSSVTYTYPYAATPAARDISFGLAPGQAMLCTGRSGCGKSTLIRLANGLIPHCLHGTLSGRVSLAGQSTVHSTPAELACSAGTLFQDPERQFFALTVRDELGIGLQWRGWKAERIDEAVAESAALLGIEDLLPQSIFGLSEGQKQKVALASLLAAQPKLLLLDEPSANLDPESTIELALTLNKLKARGLALFVVDHRLAWMRDVADRVLVMDNGRIIAQGDFSLLDDAELRERHGLRAARVEDQRLRLPEAASLDRYSDELFLESKGVFACGGQVGEPKPMAAALGGQNFFACRDLSFAYPKGKKIFQDKSLDFAQGRIIALLGENGAGKTTLARLLTGLEKPQSGAVWADGRTVKPRRLVRHAQVVLQNASHQLRMNSVSAELEDALPDDIASSERGRAVRSCLERYGLAHLAARHPQSLSGGEQQRLAVACAAVRRPRMLILDEPTSGLDGENMRRMAAAMQQAARDGACLLVITHDLELMNRVCTEKIVLHKEKGEALQ